MRKARTKPGYLAALHLGEGDCGAQKRIELASGLPDEQIQDPAEGQMDCFFISGFPFPGIEVGAGPGIALYIAGSFITLCGSGGRGADGLRRLP